jgi:hypothetical protein
MTPEEEVAAPRYIGILEQCKNAENDLWAAYTKIATVAQAVGGVGNLPVDVLRRYNASRDLLLVAAEDWVEARAKTPRDALAQAGEDPDKAPVPPPAFTVAAQGGFGSLDGFGAAPNATIPIRDVRVVFGPVGAERTLPLGDPLACQLRPTEGALGAAFAVGFVLVFLSLGFVTLCIAVAIREWKRDDVATNRSNAQQAEANAAAIKTEVEGLKELTLKCTGEETDPKHRLACLQAAGKAVKEAVEATPKPVPPKKEKGVGLIGTVAVVIVTAAASVGIYAFWSRRQRQKRAAKAPTETPEEQITPPRAVARYRRA